ncbi:hypothetical protein RQP46_001017 [Phenoliferia psychrophenolica]
MVTSLAAGMQMGVGGCDNTVHIPANWPMQIFKDPQGTCYPVVMNKVLYFSHYGYNPKVSTGIVFFTIFGILAALHIGLSIRAKRYGLLVTAVGCLVEFAGWAGRALSGVKNDASTDSSNYYMIQIVSLTIAPVFFSAVCYGTFVTLVNETRPNLSRISPGKLVYLFVTCDIVSLGLQATGGGLITSPTNTMEQQTMDKNIMLGGIIFQLAVMVVFSIYASEFFLRLHRRTTKMGETFLPGGLKWCAAGVGLASLCIIVRGGYRTAELLGGFDGPIMDNETIFLAADAAMMVLCGAALAASHPFLTVARPTDSFSRFGGEGKTLQSESERRMTQHWETEDWAPKGHMSRRTSFRGE